MARVTGPLFSMTASGTIGKAITYGKWKGRAWCRKWFKPENPKDPKQVNVRTAWALLVSKWQAATDSTRANWDTYAVPFSMSGFNKYVSVGMLKYVEQLTTEVLPVSLTVQGDPPDDVWTWTGPE